MSSFTPAGLIEALLTKMSAGRSETERASGEEKVKAEQGCESAA